MRVSCSIQPEQTRLAETREWFVKADADLRAARTDLSVQPPLTGDATFHAQQLADKAMKGLLTWHDQPFRKSHNLVQIGEQCLAVEPHLEPLLRLAGVLSEYAWRYRYPGEPNEPTQEETRDAIALAREVLEAILTRLPAEVRP